MATLSYRDPVTKEWVPLPSLAGPEGPMGPIGPTGPSGAAGSGTDEVVIDTVEPDDPALELWVSLSETPTGGKKYVAVVGDGTATSINVTHGLGTEDIVVAAYTTATKQLVFTDVTIVDANTTTFGFEAAPAAGAVKVVVMG